MNEHWGIKVYHFRITRGLQAFPPPYFRDEGVCPLPPPPPLQYFFRAWGGIYRPWKLIETDCSFVLYIFLLLN